MGISSINSASALYQYDSQLLAQTQPSSSTGSSSASTTANLLTALNSQDAGSDSSTTDPLLALLSSGTSSSGSGSAAASQLLSALTAAPSNASALAAEQQLQSTQSALGKTLSGALSAAGVSLSGEVSFSLGSSGQLQIEGDTSDQTALQNFFAQDTRSPSLESQITSALTSAQTVSQTAQQDNAIGLAASCAGSSGDLMSLYQQFAGEAQTASPVMTLSGDTSTLSYPGSLNTQA